MTSAARDLMDTGTPALTDSEREALRRGVAVRVLTEDPDDSYTRIGDPADYEPVIARIVAARVAEAVAQARAEERERIAAEFDVRGSLPSGNWRRLVRLDDAYRRAARIARSVSP